ncbi:hypothetical protein ACFRCG_15370 [Embleya sp. NPDC056575]|uniref:hypothetical protein n=1 Tax=unclassified Embleya TaxID=2699296 RepID=UPI003675ED72
MFRTRLSGAPFAQHVTDAFSVLDMRTTGAPAPRLTAEAAASPTEAARPIVPPRPQLRRARRVGVPQPPQTGRRTATSSGYRPR